MKDLEIIAEKISQCQKCVLGKTRTNTVPGSGNPSADLMFIGEGPGKNEDQQGLPFVGQAGKFLEEMLGKIKMKREDVFITNIVKCRPPGNRDPLPEEVQTCSGSYLYSQIALIKPKIIITLGRHAMEFFIPERTISEIHGQPKRIINKETGKKQVFLPLYHPAAALYNGGLRETLIKDFKKIPKILEKIKKI